MMETTQPVTMAHTTSSTKPVPVLFIIHSLGHGGMERQVAMLARNLDPKRFQPHVAAVVDGFRAEELRQHGIPVFQIPIVSFFKPGPLALGRELRKYIREHGIELVHLFDAGLSLIALLATRPSRGVRLLTSQRFYMHLAKWSHRLMLVPGHWLSDGVVVNSADTRRHLHEDYYLPMSRIEVCYNGIDSSVFHPEPRRRLELLADADLVVGCVCVLRPEKNLELLIQAFAKVRASTALRTKLLLMGSGPEEQKLKALAADLGLGDSCHFLPSAAEVSTTMRSIDIFVHPSRTESLPNAVMEAMACGCCVISSRVGGCPELMENGVHGLLVKADDLDELTAQLKAVIVDPEWRGKMAAAAARRMAENFSVTASVQQMEDIYDRRLAATRR
jgi:glycosyltransferase involved in cell wall biosynthesis